MKYFGLGLLMLTLLLVAAGVGRSTSDQALTTYEARGTFRSFNAATGEATISHGDIPGYMEAMTMPYPVRDHAVVQTLRPGDRVDFRLCVRGVQVWVDHLRRIDPISQRPPAVRPSRVAISRHALASASR